MQKMAFSKQLSDSLECPICHDLLCNPKLLPCSHSFCTSCLTELHSFQQADSGLTCPVCRQDANVPGNDVCNFPTNLIVKSLVEDFKRRSDARAERTKGDGGIAVQICTVCDGDDQDIATYYCQNCTEFLCEDCFQHHNRYKRNAYHETVKVSDIEAGVVKKKFTCPEHPQELQQFVCTTCLVRICCRCREVEHKEDGHEVIEMTGYEKSQQEKIECLLLKIEQTFVDIPNELSSVNEKLRTVKNVMSQRRQEIINAYDSAEEMLQRKRNALFEECSTHEKKFCQKLEDIIRCYYDFIETLSENVTLVNEGARSLHLPDQSLAEHTTRVNELERSLRAEALSPLIAQASNVVLRAESIFFSSAYHNIDLGTVQVKDHQLDKDLEDSVCEATCMAPTIEDTPEKKDMKDLHSTHSSVSNFMEPESKSLPDSDDDTSDFDYYLRDLHDVTRITEQLERDKLSVGTSDLSDTSISDTSDVSARPESNRSSTRSFFANLKARLRSSTGDQS
ncbi:tripartite motif-containing protein 45-like [Lytechinus variegatus]|uniref:tripartite motif-containing protein 45-like n=1 Tax=Lytechinus variegatus TaxID=7654 RepID=UPI001BB221EC|nr:tripartite motif-containing protein 45-like [Lytechinus variegatus]